MKHENNSFPSSHARVGEATSGLTPAGHSHKINSFFSFRMNKINLTIFLASRYIRIKQLPTRTFTTYET